jgi:hypothetical protein
MAEVQRWRAIRARRLLILVSANSYKLEHTATEDAHLCRVDALDWSWREQCSGDLHLCLFSSLRFGRSRQSFSLAN